MLPPKPVILREPPRKPFSLQDLWRRPKDLAGRIEGLAFMPLIRPRRRREKILRSRASGSVDSGYARALPQDDCPSASVLEWFSNTLSGLRGRLLRADVA